MKLLLSVFDPRRIAGQIALLIVLSVLLVHAIFAGMFLLRSPGPGEPGGRPLQERLVVALRALDAAPDEASRATTLEVFARAFPSLSLAVDRDAVPSPSEHFDPGLDHIRHGLEWSGIPVVALPHPASAPQNAPTTVVATMHDGTRISARLDLKEELPPGISFAIHTAILFIAISFALLSLWAARALTSPLTRFSAAAESFSVDGDTPPLPEEGPIEVKTLSRALNRMRERIRRLVDDRTRMLAAVSHDLRTPITRLRLRAEFIGDEGIRGPMLRDLDQMNAMISGALAHLRDGQSGESQAKVELSSLLATISDDFCDIGHDVAYEGPPRLVVLGRSDELARAVTNLVENAIKYGGSALLKLRAFPSVVEIDVIDQGPGMSPADRRRALWCWAAPTNSPARSRTSSRTRSSTAGRRRCACAASRAWSRST